MRFGIVLPGTLRPRALVDAGHAAELAGWDGVFVRDSLLGSDVWVALAAIAVRTERVRLGPLTAALPRHRPWKLAGETVALDHLSDGRLILPVGLGGAEDEGWDRLGMVEEMDRRVRAKLLDEGLDVLSGLWRGVPFTYQGERFNIRDVQGQPPLQQPRIPIWVPGAGWPDVPRSAELRILAWDGVIVDAGVDVAALRFLVAEHRAKSDTFEVVLEGNTPPHDRVKARAMADEIAASGVSWWLEAPPDDADPSHVRERIEQGPPR